MKRWKSEFGELRATTRLVQANLLALDFTGIAGDEAGLAQGSPQGLIVFHQCTGDAMTDCTGLTSSTTTGDGDLHVKTVGHVDQFQRLAHDHACGLAAEILVQRLAVDHDGTVTRTQEYACGGGFATASAVILGCCSCHSNAP